MFLADPIPLPASVQHSWLRAICTQRIVPLQGPFSEFKSTQELGRRDIELLNLYNVQTNLVMKSIHTCGSKEQQAKYLPALSSGGSQESHNNDQTSSRFAAAKTGSAYAPGFVCHLCMTVEFQARICAGCRISMTSSLWWQQGSDM